MEFLSPQTEYRAIKPDKQVFVNGQLLVGEFRLYAKFNDIYSHNTPVFRQSSGLYPPVTDLLPENVKG